MNKLTAFLAQLDAKRIGYSLAHSREDALLVAVAVPGERWEIEFLVDRSVEVERFVSDGEIYDEAMLIELFDRYGESSDPPISTLSDVEVLAIADLKMSVEQNQRLTELQSKGKVTDLSEMERDELASLLYLYQIGQLRKSEGLAEAVQRGLRKPLSS